VLARPDITSGRLFVPFNHVLISKDSYYLVHRESQTELGKIAAFRQWMLDMVLAEQADFTEQHFTNAVALDE
ncbi:transcriptional regulator, partial [Alishewanella sp. SMS9]|nr:transcriptional regulator [Alishewanella sp. SMS9]